MGACLLFAALLNVQAAGDGPATPKEQAEPDGEIIVTGERIARTERETASSVALFDEDDIESGTADRVDQILAMVPNVQLGNGSQGPAIRGLDTTGPLSALPAFLGGNRPRTTIVVDGRPVTYNEFVFGAFPLWDVDQIEVFRTPQTTSQGQNSIAGAIFVNSKDPGPDPEFRGRAIVGNLGMRQVSAVASGPIGGDFAALRISGDLRYSNAASNIEDIMRGADPNHDAYGLLRAKLLLDPGPDSRIELSYVHSLSQAPQIVGVSRPFERRRNENPTYGVFRVKVDSLSALARQRFSSSLTANAVLTGGKSLAQRFALPNFGETTSEGRDWSGEAVVNWNDGGTLSAVGGIAHSHVRIKQHIDLSLLSGSIGRFLDRQDGTGIFADAKITLSTRATLNVGIRYQRDRQVREGALTADTFIVPVDFVGKFDAWLPKLTLSYDLTPSFRVGAMVQRAYNPGGVTIRVDTAQPDYFDAETLWDYEAFARAEFAGGRATATANIFYYDMADAQRSQSIIVLTPDGRRAGFANLFNVPKARSYGAEGQVEWRLTEAFSAKLSAGLLATKIIDSSDEYPGLKGNRFDRSPSFTGAAALDWTPSERIRISLQMRHRSSYFTDPANTPALKVGSATFADARAEYRIGDTRLFGQVRNLFDRFAMLDLALLENGQPQNGEAEAPRMFGFGIDTRF